MVFICTNKWFKYVIVTERKVKERYLDFDDGWSHKHFWTKWKEIWMFVKLN